METIIKSHRVKIAVTTANAEIRTSSAAGFWQRIEFMRFGIIPMLLVVVACMGGIAAAFGAKDDAVKLGLIAFPTILTLAFTLAVAPMRVIVWSGIISVLIQIAVLIF
jgi:hypothetical protein